MAVVPRVISIEDDQGIFDLIRLTLRPLPVELYHASTGEEALALASTLEPDLVLLDIALPDIHGWDVLSQINSMDVKLKGVVVLTARPEAEQHQYARWQNIDVYMCKPFIPAELRHNVRQILGLA
jgi:DNA-binding response OmpR family regulator